MGFFCITVINFDTLFFKLIFSHTSLFQPARVPLFAHRLGVSQVPFGFRLAANHLTGDFLGVCWEEPLVTIFWLTQTPSARRRLPINLLGGVFSRLARFEAQNPILVFVQSENFVVLAVGILLASRRAGVCLVSQTGGLVTLSLRTPVL
jgi:hypothetical protein